MAAAFGEAKEAQKREIVLVEIKVTFKENEEVKKQADLIKAKKEAEKPRLRI